MSFPKYPKYKDSGVEWLGEVPEHWEISQLKRTAKLTTGMTPPTDEHDNYSDHSEFQWVRPEDLNESGAPTVASKFISLKGWEQVRKVTRRSSLICCIGTIGKVGFVADEVSTNQQITAASFRRNPRYFYHSLCASKTELEVASTGNVLRILNSERLGNVRLPCPPENEADVIASFLDHETAKIDELVAEQRRLIELLKEKRQAVISHAVTKGLNPNVSIRPSSIEWLGEVPEHWDELDLKRLIKSGTSITYGIVQAGPDVEGGVPYIRTSDMSGDQFPRTGYLRTSREIDESYARSRVRPGDLVVAIRASLGKGLLLPQFLDGANLTQGTAKVSPGDRMTSEFLCWAFNSPYCQMSIDQVAKGTTFREITLGQLRCIRLVVPPIQEQKEIASYLSDSVGRFNTLTTEAERGIELLQERRTALISAAVTGKIDVRSFAPKLPEVA
jgi:type I restriction enzyme S subunit